jgi:hypothetical protein
VRMIAFTYRCPSTGMLVQSWATDADGEGTQGLRTVEMTGFAGVAGRPQPSMCRRL